MRARNLKGKARETSFSIINQVNPNKTYTMDGRCLCLDFVSNKVSMVSASISLTVVEIICKLRSWSNPIKVPSNPCPERALPIYQDIISELVII